MGVGLLTFLTYVIVIRKKNYGNQKVITKQFITAGKATFTVSNDKGEHYTYRITSKPATCPGSRDGDMVYFASLLTNPDQYTYIGVFDPDLMGQRNWNVKLTKASRYTNSTKPYQVLCWALQQIAEQKALPVGYSIQHASCCGRCGRELTTPESIETGFGPECSSKLGIAYGRQSASV